MFRRHCCDGNKPCFKVCRHLAFLFLIIIVLFYRNNITEVENIKELSGEHANLKEDKVTISSERRSDDDILSNSTDHLAIRKVPEQISPPITEKISTVSSPTTGSIVVNQTYWSASNQKSRRHRRFL
jgi:hypothetical protein